MKNLTKYFVIVGVLFSFGCSSFGSGPQVVISPIKPLVARGLTEYSEKRAVLLAVREPVSEPGLGKWFSGVLFTELLGAAPFASMGNHAESIWFGLQSTASEEFSTAAELGRELGYDLVIIAEIERFVYGRTANSLLIVNFHVIDSSKGELLHSRKVKAEGLIGYMPPYRDVSLNNPVHRDDLFQSLAINLVNGLREDWAAPDAGEPERDYEQSSR